MGTVLEPSTVHTLGSESRVWECRESDELILFQTRKVTLVESSVGQEKPSEILPVTSPG